MRRSQIRYSLQRVKTGTADANHLEVFEKYRPILEKYDLAAEGFAVDWDVHESNLDEVVSGKIVQAYSKKVEQSLFDEEGKLR